ncbi:fluoride efflux transporter CrcB [Gelria sp. Kuro-4]|uniref:fluoride efflux transporter CrcB n=1 Tax=Gelria sp. Kuro-4 TaxID=2796927 RepID=UPI001C82342B|nr:fluoride efflux transporter CrcB [Gelria sp. Kuro-4]
MALDVILGIALGGSLGALARYFLSLWIQNLFGDGFPIGTLVINVSGAFVLGFVYVLSLESSLNPVWRNGLTVGFLGAFTTFSTFALETFLLIQEGLFLNATLNVIITVILGLLGAFFGGVLAKFVSGI